MVASPLSAEDLDNALWRFAVRFYGRDGVAAACLTLQDRLGVDVNILMLAIFAQVHHGVRLSRDDVATVDALTRDWRTQIVQPLRRMRTRMKSGPTPAPSSSTDRLRNHIKAAELEAEQVQLAAMNAWLAQSALQPSLAAAPLVVARYFAAGVPFAPEVDAALETLTRAMQD